MYPPVSPIAFQLGPLAVHWYGLTMTAAILSGTYIASLYVASRGEAASNIWDMLLWVIIPAVVGARLYYVFIQSSRGPNGLGEYLAHPIEILEVWRGGIHIYGALIFGGIAVLLFVRWRRLPLLIYLDSIALGLLVGQVIGRLGNFFNQELYGPPTTLPWGLRIDPAHRVAPYNNLTLYPESTRFQPLFLYEMIWNTIGFFLLLWIARRFSKQLRNGDLLLLYLIWYPFGRFFLEFMRSDSWFFPGTPFNLVHLLSAISVITASTILYLRHRGTPAAQQPWGTRSAQLAQDNGVQGSKGDEEPQLAELNSTDASNATPVDGIAIDGTGGV
ncbi:MAG TPA: prolipoprotein diacylglyceryl transferase [Ktedonobacteraceae bacterium]|nr:prolipoprotein diacylglyceryl transferase [Ktedonobacteraceae bacterium]